MGAAPTVRERNLAAGLEGVQPGIRLHKLQLDVVRLTAWREEEHEALIVDRLASIVLGFGFLFPFAPWNGNLDVRVDLILVWMQRKEVGSTDERSSSSQEKVGRSSSKRRATRACCSPEWTRVC